jgi:SpoVK/Ycf46/Vps4 family AAA+-type ATPase
VAELIKKPLYPITCGALGETVTEIESRLNHHLALASRWDCVVLLDEADLFLARRSRESYERNSIVVLFLRILDYYSGILIMTTNRVGIIDEGFISRIHLSLYCKLRAAILFRVNRHLIIAFRSRTQRPNDRTNL